MTKKFYLTTPLYYVNSFPHIGHAYTTIAADILARYKRQTGHDVHFLTGTDEHGGNIEKAAAAMGKTPQEWTDHVAGAFKDLWKELNISYDDFIRTTEPRHIKPVQAVFEKLLKTGDIYKGSYKGNYCFSCEAYIDDTEAVDGCCPIHKKPLTPQEEETYFFKLSKFEQPLLDFYKANPDFLSPHFRANEILNFVKGGLRDLSVTRTKVAWGVPLLSDPSHTIYVWFDALLNYATAPGLGTKLCAEDPLFKDYPYSFDQLWPADVHFIGKEIYRFHAVIWPAILMALGLTCPKKVFAHGWWTVEGEKMSKSRGNIVNPTDITSKYGVDPLRFFIFREVPFGGDGDFSMSAFVARFNSDLANDMGNLLSRVLNMAGKNMDELPKDEEPSELIQMAELVEGKIEEHMNNIALDKALEEIWSLNSAMNKHLDTTKPWTLAKTDKEGAVKILKDIVFTLRRVATYLAPFMPETSAKMLERLAPGPVGKYEPLFPRLETEKK
ncbi:methionyl-tRNA synthetase [Parelusimicrobium proximum]|uniref:methionine--tRNA ligase n=1 Tax=Parelusimicrobium proximum TaxID=3228953 RepID=UPI003D167D65